jgi:hypothetical protein
MPDIAGTNGQREEFRVVGKRNLPGKLSYALATGVAKFGIDYVMPICCTPSSSEVPTPTRRS